jgi:hypothetical protein
MHEKQFVAKNRCIYLFHACTPGTEAVLKIVYEKVICERWWVTKLCVKNGG